ncbi:ABC transporter ATP-binding protein [Saccharothrix luteola]|uniref:ABC transporter ATP-binding protein n=1 Tax=Saccharothrix luteola TaxID=2893018 RepID=UPI001E427425|nr:ABC transporter ATP-binding protein [Saccharothrix luteola]MCC8250519.1 ABC transporter ATP-binding protein [Saccharothrix luteola]
MSEQADSVLSVLEVHKSYGDVPVFTDVTFTVAPGEALAIVGRNGAGKSTLLKCLVGAEIYDDGSVFFLGEPLDETSSAVRAKMASLLDDVDFFPDVSVVEHLRLLAWLHGTDDPEQRVQDIVADLGLQQVRDQLPPTLSSGQLHRLGLASCFVRPRELLVLDEPEQRLDIQGRLWLGERLNEEKALGVAVVFASHDEELVDTVADRAIQLPS